MYYHVQLQARFSNVSFSIQAPKCCSNTRKSGAPNRRDVVSLPPPKVGFISSTSNPFVKHCLKLRQSSSYRQSQGSAVVVGITPIKEISQLQLLQGDEHFVLECLLLLEGAEAPNGLGESIGHIISVSSNVMKKLSGVQSVDSITAIAIMRIPNSFYKLHDNEGLEACENWLSCAHRILTLDGIQVDL
ncbi:hypothetical protein H6P81_017773 [Aristolochia fimbriata]|uniref:Uncharacterized protein n=1 Tax=Aristolochia fimbriata TaxID=158543 RepID=A0AAV7DZK4_ARIFI|nr:hypothetical protein H6P81_017773 [Aristolochia fimbriata]